MKTAVILGTRPEIIKMSPLIRLLKKQGSDFYVLHTGQHYSHNLDGVFFEQLRLDPPKYNLHVGSGTHAEETGKMLMGIEEVLARDRPSIALVEGDTNTVLAGSLAAAKLGVRLGHVEAGLRSGDRSMPEELNRIVSDHLSDLLFAPTRRAKGNLIQEGVRGRHVHITGNTIVDAVKQNAEIARDVDPGALVGGRSGDYALATVHRQENTDDPERLRGIVSGLELLAEETGVLVVYPAHPRAKNALMKFGLHPDPSKVRVVPPIDYLAFLRLELGARLVLTDSGGVQEEACILKVPCVTLRYNTERPETLDAGANVLGGTEPSRIMRAARIAVKRKREWRNPFGDGHAAERILEIIGRAP